jgi:hypothetical protein
MLSQYTAADLVVKLGCRAGSHTAAYSAFTSSDETVWSLEFNSPASARSRRNGLRVASSAGSKFLNLSCASANAGRAVGFPVCAAPDGPAA